MSRLNIRLLGPFEVVLDERTVTAFESDKVRALLAFLAAEAGQAHRRERLAGMLWPEMSESQARMNLRGALADLRQAIVDHRADPPFLEITRQTIQFNPSADSWVDVRAFEELTGAGAVRKQTVLQLEQAIPLYRGQFLQGFSIPDSASFEEWVTVSREQFARHTLAALDRLAAYHQEGAAYQTAIAFARRHLDLDPTAEGAHRRLMLLLALNGQNAVALEHFKIYRDFLDRELGVQPTDETLELVDRIKRGELRAEARPRPDRIVRGYELRESIGEGNFGTVFRAYQPLVGREVAVKIIQPKFANEPEFIRRFEAEAQLVAKVEHLHIVPLYDYWREPGGAYLVMRLFRAGSLKDSLRRGPWDLKSAARLMDQMAMALIAAHQQDVVHRDVKPANILLDEEGNAYLSDFGIAKALDGPSDADQSGAVTGSPAYMAPEQIANQQVTSRTDQYSLGVVLYELLTGQHPFPAQAVPELLERHLSNPLPSVRELRTDLPPMVDEVIQQATSKAPEDRFRNAAELARAFRGAVKAKGQKVWEVERTNPYKGLRPFEEADAGDFFGRELLTRRLLARLGSGANFLAIVGPSGSGKSSLVNAGLIPALRKGGLPGSGEWYVIDLDLGDHPLEDLAAALTGIAVSPPGSLLLELHEGEQGLLQAMRRVLPDPEARLLMVIDRFEDLFTQARDESEQKAFLSALAYATEHPDSPLKLVVVLRADFYDRPLQHPRFGQLVREHTEVVLPPDPEQLERSIVGPLQKIDLAPSGELVAAIIGDVADQPGRLPLMQYALTELFELHEVGGITLDAYRRIGGVSGALGRRAEEIYGNLNLEEQNAARQVFLRLVRLGEGASDTRRRVSRPRLTQLPVEAQAISAIIDLYGEHRLLTFDRDPETRAPTVELAHEALLREWPRFRSWIEQSREGLRLQQRLRRAAAEWEQSARDPSSLLRGKRLDEFEVWARHTDLALDLWERDFLEASLAERRTRQAAEAERWAQEAELERRSIRRLRALVVVLAVAAVGAVALSAAAINSQRTAQAEAVARSTQQAIAEAEAAGRATQQSIAEVEAEARTTQQALAEQSAKEAVDQAQIATSRELAGASLANLDADPERSLLLALEAAEITRASSGTVLPEVVDALHQALQRTRVRLRLEPAGAAAFSPDGSRIVTSGPDEKARIWDSESGELLQTLSGHSGKLMNAAFSPAGDRLVTASLDATAKVWDLASGEVVLTLVGHGDGLISPAYSPDGELIVTTSLDATARLWDAQTGEPLFALPHSGPTVGPHFSPDGSLVAIADDAAAEARIWDTATGEEVMTLTGHSEGLNEVTFSPDGSMIATASSDFTVKLWDAETGAEIRTLEGHTGWVFTVEFAPDGRSVISGSQDGTVRVWEVESGKELMRLAGHTGGVGEVSVSPDGQVVVSAGEDGLARVWDLTPEGGRDWLTLAGHDDVVLEVAISSDGRLAATASWDHTAKLWDLATGAEVVTLKGHTAEVGGVAFDPEGLRVATAGYDGTIRIWDVTSGDEIAVLIGHEGPVTGVAFSPDGKLLATGGIDGTARLWDPLSGDQIRILAGHQDWVFRVAFSPDGRQLATASWDGTAKLWDLASGTELATLVGHTEPVTSIAYSADGLQLVTSSFDAQPRLWNLINVLEDPQDATSQVFAGHAGIVWDAAFSPDGTTIASASFDNTVRLWDSHTGEQTLTLSAPSAVPFANVAFSPDGRLLAASSGDGKVRIFLLPADELIAAARGRVTRSLSEAECRQYLHVDSCPG